MFSCLPQELVDLIVDKIHEDKDVPSLKSCSLAARTFVSPARRHIFGKIEILPPRPACNPCEMFYQLLTLSPHIAPLVEELCIVLVGPTSYPEARDRTERHPATRVMESSTLSLILPLLDLKRISLTENTRMTYPRDSSLHWLRLQSELKSALMDVFSETTSLKELAFSRIYFTNTVKDRQPWPGWLHWRPQLRTLLVLEMRTNKFCHYIANPQVDLTRVNSLTLRTDLMSGAEGAELLQAMRAGSGSLEHLHLWETGGLRLWEPHHYTDSSYLEKIHDLNLRTVHLSCASVSGLLSPFFQACPHDSRLERVVFEGHDAALPVSLDTGLNATIESTVAQLRSLTTVEFRVRSDNSDLLREWTVELREALPSLEQRGLLRVTKAPGGVSYRILQVAHSRS
ncbi:hypothetical protein C8R47DRAFT_1216365 [Mycena vitilis]|nr:hypothetical protein C8R47DRAFT_1216365 [Mycena vitilis]